MANRFPLLLAAALAYLAAGPTAASAQAQEATPIPAATATARQSPTQPFLDLGAGARIGIGEPTYAAVAARLGVPLSASTALSLRPMLVFGNSNSRGQRNNQSEVQLPLTLDLFTTSTVSAYVGPGLAFNTDSQGQTNASLNAGVDVKLNQRLRLSAGLTYVIQPGDSNGRDLEANTLIYLRL